MPTASAAPIAPAPPPVPERVQRTKLWHNVAVRLADEGVPVRAISRCLIVSTEDIRDVLGGALERGMILSIPRDDWPPGTRRDERQPDTIPLEYMDDHMTMLAMRTFTFTGAMARMFIALLRRPELTKQSLHLCTARDPDYGNGEPTLVKIVDVFICKMRKKLPATIPIVTIWGKGYSIPPEGKAAALELMGVKHDDFVPTSEANTPPVEN